MLISDYPHKNNVAKEYNTHALSTRAQKLLNCLLFSLKIKDLCFRLKIVKFSHQIARETQKHVLYFQYFSKRYEYFVISKYSYPLKGTR